MDNGASSYRRFLDGDEDAFAEIVENYREGLVFFIARIVGDEATAEDIAIDVFADVLLHRGRYHFKTTLKTYLYMLGRSRALDVLRRRKRIEFVPLSEAEGETHEMDSPEERVFLRERNKVLHEALARLPEDMKIAVHLVYFEELSYEETAKVMKKNRKQVDNLLTRAKSELRFVMGEEGKRLL